MYIEETTTRNPFIFSSAQLLPNLIPHDLEADEAAYFYKNVKGRPSEDPSICDLPTLDTTQHDVEYPSPQPTHGNTV